ncbi:MAG: Uma2 family endonuclease, partial [Chloroflexota bacterium]
QSRSRQLVEFNQGIIEILPEPSAQHTAMVNYLFDRLSDFVADQSAAGQIIKAPAYLQVDENVVRAPDLMFVPDSTNTATVHTGAEFVLEVVSRGDHIRDLETKRKEYAAAGVKEYWVFDPRLNKIRQLLLNRGRYQTKSVIGAGGTAVSQQLPAFQISADEVFNI